MLTTADARPPLVQGAGNMECTPTTTQQVHILLAQVFNIKL
jgi:hypothetical protein